MNACLLEYELLFCPRGAKGTERHDRRRDEFYDWPECNGNVPRNKYACGNLEVTSHNANSNLHKNQAPLVPTQVRLKVPTGGKEGELMQLARVKGTLGERPNERNSSKKKTLTSVGK